MTTKILMKVDAISHEPPMMPGMGYSRSPFGVPEDAPIFLALVATKERRDTLMKRGSRSEAPETLYERPTEKVKIKSEHDEEGDAEIIHPMVGGFPQDAMMTRVPTILMHTHSEFKALGKPTIGDSISLTIESETTTKI